MMRVMGIDPGLAATGWGVIEVSGAGCRHVAHGAVRTRTRDGLGARLVTIRDGIRAAAVRWEPGAAAVELSFVGNNARSALALGHARAAAIIGLEDAGVAIHEYSPNLVKQTVAGYGHGAKAQVSLMVRLQLGMDRDPSPADAADALALAITHWAHARLHGA